MKIKGYEVLAKEITGLNGRHITKRKIKLEDGSTLMIGDQVALQVINSDTEYGSIMYDKFSGEWKSSSMDIYKKKNPDDVDGQILDNVYTFSEAAQKWELSDGSVLRNAVRQGRFNKEEYKQSGSVWLITKEGMERVYGKAKK